MTDIPSVKLYYRIIEMDEQNYAFVVRYWSDTMNEDSLATVYDNDGNIVRGEDGKPVRCQTDFNYSLFDHTNPTVEEIEKMIIQNAHSLWFYTKEQLKSGNNAFNMDGVKSMFQKTTSFEKKIKDVDDKGISLQIIGETLAGTFPGKDIILTIKSTANTNNATMKVEYI